MIDPLNSPYPWDAQPEDASSPCGCGDPRCRIDGNDASNVNVKGVWYACDCVGLCYFCGETDSLHRLVRVSGSWLSHEGCVTADPNVSAELDRQARADEERDEMNQVRR